MPKKILGHQYRYSRLNSLGSVPPHPTPEHPHNHRPPPSSARSRLSKSSSHRSIRYRVLRFPVEHRNLIPRRGRVPLKAVDVFNHGYIRKRALPPDADVAHPDDADPPDRAAFPDGGARFLVMVCISVLSSRLIFCLLPTPFCGAGRARTALRRVKCHLAKLFMSTIQSEIE